LVWIVVLDGNQEAALKDLLGEKLLIIIKEAENILGESVCDASEAKRDVGFGDNADVVNKDPVQRHEFTPRDCTATMRFIIIQPLCFVLFCMYLCVDAILLLVCCFVWFAVCAEREKKKYSRQQGLRK